MDITGKEVFKRRVLELEKLGHRGSATVFEDRAADYLINELSASDIEANKEIFDGSNSLGARLLLHIVIAATGLAFISSFPIVTILVSVLTLISFIGEASTRFRILTRLLPKVQSRNVIGRIPSLNKNKPIYRLILCAHIDTQRIGLIWKDYIVKRASMLYSIVPGPMKSPFFILMLNFILQLFVGILSLILPTNALINIMLWIIAVSYAIHGFLFAEWTIGKYSPGACDNATGCAAAIAIAEYWLNNSVDNIELVILLTGCEETGLLGAAAWLDKHKTELKMSSNLFLNLDTLGYGAPRFLKKEFTMAAIPVSYPKEILSICDTAAQHIDLKKTGPYILPTFTDATAFLNRGILGASILTFEENNKNIFMPNYHQMTDTSSQLSFDVGWQATLYGWEVLMGLAQLFPITSNSDKLFEATPNTDAF